MLPESSRDRARRAVFWMSAFLRAFALARRYMSKGFLMSGAVK